MFWDNEKDSDWTQRWKNGVFLKWWVKNETRDAVLPWVVLVALILLALTGIARLFGMHLGFVIASAFSPPGDCERFLGGCPDGPAGGRDN